MPVYRLMLTGCPHARSFPPPFVPNQPHSGWRRVSEYSHTLHAGHTRLHQRSSDILHTPSQVVRYTALLSGIVYGFVHNRTLHKEAEVKKANAAIKQRESWIEQAKKEYAQKQSQSTTSSLKQLASSATGGIIGGDNGELALLALHGSLA